MNTYLKSSSVTFAGAEKVHLLLRVCKIKELVVGTWIVTTRVMGKETYIKLEILFFLHVGKEMF